MNINVLAGKNLMCLQGRT